MADCRMKLVGELEMRLSSSLAPDIITKISDSLIQVLANYEISEMTRELTIYDTTNDRILKRYCACLFVDGKSEKTISQYARICKKLADFTGTHFTKITAYEIRLFLATQKDRGLSDRTIENYRSYISAFFKWLEKEDLIDKNPCNKINPVKYEDVIRKPFSDVEIDKLRSACRTERERSMIEVLLSSGIRVSELCDLRKTDIDPSDKSLYVRNGKGRKDRTTYITDLAMTHLSIYWAGGSPNVAHAFLNSRSKSLNTGGVRYILKQIGERAGVLNVHPHRFRRTFASNLAKRGMDIQEIRKLLGHSNINTTLEYVYTSDEKVNASYRHYIA